MDPTQMTDEQLLPLYGLPEHDQVTLELHRRMDSHVAGAIRCHVRDRHGQDDCMNETWLKVLRKKYIFVADGTPESARRWICTIAHNTGRDYASREAARRKHQRLESTLGEGNLLKDHGAEATDRSITQALCDWDEASQAIQRLPLMDQAILLLYHLGNLNQTTTAHLVGYANASAICERSDAVLKRLRSVLTNQNTAATPHQI